MSEILSKASHTIAFYRRVARNWWLDMDGRRISQIRDFEANLARDTLQLQAGHTVLSLGIGTANDEYRMNIPSELMTRLNWIGLDFSRDMLSVAQEKMPNITLIQANMLEPFTVDEKTQYAGLPIKKESIDRCLCHHVLCHLPAIGIITKSVQEVLKQGGLFVFNELVNPMQLEEKSKLDQPTFAGNYPRHKDKSLMAELDGLEYLRNSAEYVRCLAKTGFEILSFRYITENSIFIAAIKL